MGRGLSDLQRGILGIAYTVNAHTQGGEARPKEPVSRGLRRYLIYKGVPFDYRTPLGVCLLYRIAPSLHITRHDPRCGEVLQAPGGYFADSPATRAATVATSRAAGNLVRRGLLADSVPNWRGYVLGGYVLTEAGLEVGRAHARPIPLIVETLAYFRVIDTGAGDHDACYIIDHPALIRALAAELADADAG